MQYYYYGLKNPKETNKQTPPTTKKEQHLSSYFKIKFSDICSYFTNKVDI